MRINLFLWILIGAVLMSSCQRAPMEEEAKPEQAVLAEQSKPADLPPKEQAKDPAPLKEPSSLLSPEKEEEEVPFLTVQQVAPLKGQVHLLLKEDADALFSLLERQEWGEKNLLYQAYDFEIVAGEKSYFGYFDTNALNGAEEGTRLEEADRLALEKLLEQYLGVYAGEPTVEGVLGKIPCQVMSEADWQILWNTLKRVMEDPHWSAVDPAFEEEFLFLSDHFGLYYDRNGGRVSNGTYANSLLPQEQEKIEEILKKYSMFE